LFIIFDLDDTLIDTSSCIAPAQLKRALGFAQTKGLVFSDVDCARLLAEHVKAVSCEMALKEFLEAHGASSSLILETLQQYRSLPDPDLAIPEVPNAKEVLEVLKPHRLAIVTIGVRELQLYKLKKAGFFAPLFSKIIVATERNKKIHYQSLLEEFGHKPEETVVVGDRIEVDLLPAKELGCKAIRLMRGRGAYDTSKEVKPDHTIYDLKELPNLIR
jgi:HAD superfamily hydrolase (TIGR01549 family)